MIEKITDHNLERYDSRLKEWCDRKFFEKGNYGKYETTEEAGAVAFYPAPDTPLEGKVKFSFMETPPASGDKSPTNPSVITGVSSVKVTRCGKNIVKYPFYQTTKTENGITWTDNGDGTVTANGTATRISAFHLIKPYWNSDGGMLLQPGTYRLSGCPAGGTWDTYRVRVLTSVDNTNSGYVTVPADTGSGSNIVMTKASIVSCAFDVSSGVTVSNLVFKPQLELGSTATAFEPYDGADYTVNLGNTYYGGEIDLATGVMTVTRKKTQAVAGSNSALEIVNGVATCVVLINESVKRNNSALCCTRFPTVDSIGVEGVRCRSTDGFWSVVCQINTSRLDLSSAANPSNPTLAEIQAAFAVWLTANPMDIVFQPVNMPIIQLTSTQILSLSQTDKYTSRLNTVYTDADSIQISYLKSPIRDEYEKTQAILSLGGNS